MSRAINAVAFTLPFVIAAAVQAFGGEWSKESWPAWVWLSITAAAIFFTFFISVTRRGYNLAKEKEPKIIIKGVDVLERSGEQYIRIRILNDSEANISGAKARLNTVTDRVGALEHGHKLNSKGNTVKLHLPIQLFTSERPKERLDGGDKYARPFDMAPQDEKYIEVFQITHNIGIHALVYDADKQHQLITPDDITFACEIVSSSGPLKFNVTYEAIGGRWPRFKIVLTDACGAIVDTESFREKKRDQDQADE